jgi:hypothetical protein
MAETTMCYKVRQGFQREYQTACLDAVQVRDLILLELNAKEGL